MPSANPYVQYFEAVNADLPNLTRQLKNLEQAVHAHSWMQILAFSSLVYQEAVKLMQHLSQVQALPDRKLGMMNLLPLVFLSLYGVQVCGSLSQNRDMQVNWPLWQEAILQASHYLDQSWVNHNFMQSLASVDKKLQQNVRDLVQTLKKLLQTLKAYACKLWSQVKRETSQALTFLFQAATPAPATTRIAQAPTPIIRYG